MARCRSAHPTYRSGYVGLCGATFLLAVAGGVGTAADSETGNFSGRPKSSQAVTVHTATPLVKTVADSVRDLFKAFEVDAIAGGHKPLSQEEAYQAVLWALYPMRINSVHTAVYASKTHGNLQLLADTAPFPVSVVSHGSDWKGTLDKLLGYWTFLRSVDDHAIVVLLDAFDVFGNGFDGHELLRRYFSFNKPIVIAAEENIFPREVEAPAHEAIGILGDLGGINSSAPSRFLNAGGIIGVGWAMKKMYDDIRENMAANDPAMLMAHGDLVGHWFLHAYDQYELWRYFIRSVQAVYHKEIPQSEFMLAVDTEQLIFGSTVMQKDHWPDLLRDNTGGVKGVHSIDVDVALVFDAPQSVFEINACRARFAGREHFPIFWHGHGPWKPAWEGLRDRMRANGCFPAGKTTQPTDDMYKRAAQETARNDGVIYGPFIGDKAR